MANRSDGAGSYLFGGQGSATPPFVDAAGGVQFRGTGGQTQADGGEPLPMTLDGAAAWLQAPHRQRRLRRPSAGAGNGRRLDRRRPRDRPERPLTGATYSVQFSVGGGVTTYAVLKDGAADGADRRALCLRPGDRVRRHGGHGQRHAGQRRPVRDRAVDARPVGLRRARQGIAATADAAAAAARRSRRRWPAGCATSTRCSATCSCSAPRPARR